MAPTGTGGAPGGPWCGGAGGAHPHTLKTTSLGIFQIVLVLFDLPIDLVLWCVRAAVSMTQAGREEGAVQATSSLCRGRLWGGVG